MKKDYVRKSDFEHSIYTNIELNSSNFSNYVEENNYK
jgi:hypothetical protein